MTALNPQRLSFNSSNARFRFLTFLKRDDLCNRKTYGIPMMIFFSSWACFWPNVSFDEIKAALTALSVETDAMTDRLSRRLDDACKTIFVD